jgi:opacity protein-like surface antigen
MKRALFAAAVAVAAVHVPAHAQMDFIAGVFKDVRSIALSVQGGGIPGSAQLRPSEGDCSFKGVCGMAAEVLIELPSASGVELELGLGASVLRGFSADEPTLDLHGSVRSFPTVSAYAALPNALGLGIAEPYAGLSFGLSELWNARGYDPDGVRYALEAQTFEYGVAAGLYLRRPEGLFIEGSYRWRNFGSIDWQLPDAAEERLPAGWPRELDLSGWMVSVGWQFRLRDPDEDKKEEGAAAVASSPSAIRR